ncbi:MAG: FecR family protein [Mangrovibacterium sp.]
MRNDLLHTGKEKQKLLDLYLAGKLKKNQLDELLHFLQTGEGQELLEQQMRQVDFSPGIEHPNLNKNRRNRIFRQISRHSDQQDRTHLGPLLRIAASLLLILSIGAGIYYSNARSEQTGTTMVQVSGEQQPMVTLPDGTRVRLKKGSCLSYDANMDQQDTRQVTLHGEAFFEVAKKPEKPFIIDAGKAEVKVLGTKFNVRSSDVKNTIVVAVQEGKVSFTDKEQEQNIILTANEAGILEGGKLRRVDQPVQNYFSWFEHVLEFEKMPLPQVVEQLETIFDADIELADPELNDKYFTAYMRGASVDEVVTQLALSFELKLEKKGGIFRLSERKEHLTKLRNN